jgi:hypothetical protein
MDSSQITKLLQKQNTRYINRCQPVDSSTLTYQNQIQSSKYITGTPTCNSVISCNIPTQPGCPTGNGICSYGGQGKSTSLMNGSSQQFPNVFAGAAGSASRVYTSANVMLQQAGKQFCGVPGTSAGPASSYVIEPTCCDTYNDTNYSSTIINNNNNPYLPPFDTYYKYKNPESQCKNCVDKNLKHFVKQCHTRFPDANNGVSVLCTDCQNTPQTCDGCVLENNA